MQVLIVLADAQGSVVTRETLLERCWGGVFVGDDSLNRAIAGVRRIAAEVGPGSFMIETVPRTGYRLVPAPESNVVGATAASSDTRQEARMGRRSIVLGAAGVAAAGVLGAGFLYMATPDEREVEKLMTRSQLAMAAGTAEGNQQAIVLLERAVSIAPRSAAAWGLLALSLARADEHATDRTQWPAHKRAEVVQRALDLDPDNVDAQAAQAIGIPYYGDWLAAERRFDSILARDPDHLATKDSRLFLLGAVGRMRESARERLALKEVSLSDAGLLFRKVYSLWFLGRVDDADRWVSRGLEMWPGHAGIWFAKLWVLSGTGRFARAIDLIDDVAVRPKLPAPMFELLRGSMAAADSGNAAQREIAAETVLSQVRHSVTAVVNAMMMLHLLDDTDRAFALAYAYYLEDGPIIARLEWRPGQPIVSDQRRRKTNMLFVPTAGKMHRDPRFPLLMERMGLKDYWRKRGIQPDYQSMA